MRCLNLIPSNRWVCCASCRGRRRSLPPGQQLQSNRLNSQTRIRIYRRFKHCTESTNDDETNLAERIVSRQSDIYNYTISHIYVGQAAAHSITINCTTKLYIYIYIYIIIIFWNRQDTTDVDVVIDCDGSKSPKLLPCTNAKFDKLSW